MFRTFIAVELIPDFQEKIAEIQARFADFDVKLVDPKLVHITLKFLGDVEESAIPFLAAALDSILCDPFEARIEGVGVFPRPDRPKVIWLGGAGNFEKLHDEVENVLSPFKFKKDPRGFTAHATLARVKFFDKTQKKAFLEVISELKDVKLGTMRVDSVQLKKSTLTPEGPIYEILHTVRLD